jgi:uncharacterized protein YjbJ (UPF0337 family)
LEVRGLAGSKTQAKGKANKISGSVKQAAGKATGNRKMRAKGTAQKAKGAVQDAAGKTGRALTKSRKGLR